jgi:hypothetical protein
MGQAAELELVQDEKDALKWELFITKIEKVWRRTEEVKSSPWRQHGLDGAHWTVLKVCYG